MLGQCVTAGFGLDSEDDDSECCKAGREVGIGGREMGGPVKEDSEGSLFVAGSLWAAGGRMGGSSESDWLGNLLRRGTS
jgi:hypothetical protein